MAKKQFVVAIPNCSYGSKGEVIELDVPESGLTARQAIMLKEYQAPKVKQLEVATPAKEKAEQK